MLLIVNQRELDPVGHKKTLRVNQQGNYLDFKMRRTFNIDLISCLFWSWVKS